MIDSRTTLLIAAFLYLVLPIAVLWMLWRERDRVHLYWALASVCMALGILLISLRYVWPDWLTYHAGNTLLMSSFLLWAQALKRLRASAWPLPTLAACVALCTVIYSVIDWTVSESVRGASMRVVMGSLAMYVAAQAIHLAQATRSANATAIGVSFSVTGLAFVWHGLVVATGNDPNPFSNTWNASLLGLAGLVTAVTCQLSFVGLTLDLYAGDRVQYRTDTLVKKQTLQLQQQMGAMERQSSLRLAAASLAHEINQPLTAALTNAQLAQRALSLPEARLHVANQMLDKIADNAKRADHILTSIMDASESKTVQLTTVDVASCLATALEQVQYDLQRDQVSVVFNPALHHHPCSASPLELSQVFVNLLRNASQALRDQPIRHVHIWSEVQADTLSVGFDDTGPGLSFDAQPNAPRVFQTNKADGLGLGLTICHTLLERMHGHLTLHNLAQGGVRAHVMLKTPSAEVA